MNADSTFLVEDFLEAITSQLDRTQDALRLKAVNRPLTYAIRDFNIDLKVFVEMGTDGRVRFRGTGPNEEGASTVQIGFTTVTRPMIEENTVSLSAVRSPSLDELGLAEDERQRLERLGVRNAAQLARLGRSTGAATVARFAGIPVNRLKLALASGRPAVHGAAPATPAPEPAVEPDPAPVVTMPVAPEPAAHPEPAPAPTPAPKAEPRPGIPIRVPAATRRLRIQGRHLADTVDAVRLDGRPLEVETRDEDGIVVDLGRLPTSGALEVDLGDEGVVFMSLALADGATRDAEGEKDADGGEDGGGEDDPWRPV